MEQNVQVINSSGIPVNSLNLGIFFLDFDLLLIVLSIDRRVCWG